MLSLYLSGDLDDDNEQINTVNLKLDALQASGSFKIRGISQFMKRKYLNNLDISIFVTTSSANAGMAVAYSAKKIGCKCIVILDNGQKNNELLDLFKDEYGAEIQFHGSSWNDADEYALKLCEDNKQYLYVPMFDDPLIFDGHSSIIRELSDQYASGLGGDNDNYPDCIVASVGGGGLLTGILAGLFQVGWNRNVKIVAAQCENAALFDAAINNSYKPIAVRTISSEGVDLGYRAVCSKVARFAEKFSTFNPIESIIVKDVDILNICTLFADRHHVLVEPLCGVAIAALYKNKEYFKKFKNIVIIVCGGNHTYYNKKLLLSHINDDDDEKEEEKKYDKEQDDDNNNIDGYNSEDLETYDSGNEEM